MSKQKPLVTLEGLKNGLQKAKAGPNAAILVPLFEQKIANFILDQEKSNLVGGSASSSTTETVAPAVAVSDAAPAVAVSAAAPAALTTDDRFNQLSIALNNIAPEAAHKILAAAEARAVAGLNRVLAMPVDETPAVSAPAPVSAAIISQTQSLAEATHDSTFHRVNHTAESLPGGVSARQKVAQRATPQTEVVPGSDFFALSSNDLLERAASNRHTQQIVAKEQANVTSLPTIPSPSELAAEPPAVATETPVVAAEPPVVAVETPVVAAEPPVVAVETPVVAEATPISAPATRQTQPFAETAHDSTFHSLTSLPGGVSAAQQVVRAATPALASYQQQFSNAEFKNDFDNIVISKEDFSDIKEVLNKDFKTGFNSILGFLDFLTPSIKAILTISLNARQIASVRHIANMKSDFVQVIEQVESKAAYRQKEKHIKKLKEFVELLESFMQKFAINELDVPTD